MEVESVDKSFFQWVVGGLWAAISFILGWKIRNTTQINRLNTMMATTLERDKNRDKDMIEVKNELYAIRREMKSVLLCVDDQKKNNNATLIRVNKILDAFE